MTGKREHNRTQQQARILDAAHRLFSAHGFEEVTMADVAGKASVARATVFNHFGSKHALVEAIRAEVQANYEALLENAIEDDETPVPDLIRALFEVMGVGIEADRRFYRGVFREMAKLTLGLDERGPERSHAAPSALVKLLQKGQERSEISLEHRADDLALSFNALVNGTITYWLYSDSDESLHLRMRRAAEIFIRGADA